MGNKRAFRPCLFTYYTVAKSDTRTPEELLLEHITTGSDKHLDTVQENLKTVEPLLKEMAVRILKLMLIAEKEHLSGSDDKKDKVPLKVYISPQANQNLSLLKIQSGSKSVSALVEFILSTTLPDLEIVDTEESEQ